MFIKEGKGQTKDEEKGLSQNLRTEEWRQESEK